MKYIVIILGLVGIILGGIYSFSMSPLQINNTIITDNQEEKITKKDEYEIKILNGIEKKDPTECNTLEEIDAINCRNLVNYELAQSLKNKIFCSYIENEGESVNPMIETCEYEIDTQSYGIDIIEADIE